MFVTFFFNICADGPRSHSVRAQHIITVLDFAAYFGDGKYVSIPPPPSPVPPILLSSSLPCPSLADKSRPHFSGVDADEEMTSRGRGGGEGEEEEEEEEEGLHSASDSMDISMDEDGGESDAGEAGPEGGQPSEPMWASMLGQVWCG